MIDANPLPAQPELTSRNCWQLVLAGIDHLDQGITVIDEHLRMIGWNRRFLELLEFPMELGKVGTPFETFIRYNAKRGEYGPGDIETQVGERVELARRFEPHCIERVRPDGTVLEIRGNRVPGGGFVTVYTDITARKRAEAALQGSHDRLEARVAERTIELRRLNRQLEQEITERKRIAAALRDSENWIRRVMDTVPVLIAYVDTNLYYRFANRQCQDWFGLSAERLSGCRFGSFVTEQAQQLLLKHARLALNGQVTAVEYLLSVAGYPTREVRGSFTPHCDADGRVLGFFFLGQDLTEHKKTQRALNQANKLKAIGQLTGGIAHDFNNLLTIIIGNLAILESEFDPGHELREVVDTALHATERGAELIRQMLAFSRRQPLKPCPVDPAALLAELRDFLRRTLGTGVTVKIKAEAAMGCALADPNELFNALLNLAINARDAMPDGGTLTLAASVAVLDDADPADPTGGSRGGDYVLLCVTDTGTGMEPSALEQAFEPFFTTKGAGKGTGLGLSTVYGFVKQSGGHIRIESQVGVGTEVRLYLPRTALLPEPVREPAALANRTRGFETVLIVDDNPDIRRLVNRTLTQLGYLVREAENGPAALAMLAADDTIDLLLTDIMMPDGMSGWDLVAQVRERWPGVKCLFMSGYADLATSARGQELTLLQKPFRPEALVAAVRDVLLGA